MKNDFVIVSALFNIAREKMDGRKWEEYLEWFEITLRLQCPMILFITADVESFVKDRRPDAHVIVQSVDQIPYWDLKPQLDGIISSKEYVDKIKDPNRIECQHSEYSIIQYSKFKWLQEAIDINPFQSKYFFWLDAGGSRFFNDYDLTQDYPSPNALKSLNEMGETFLVQMNMEYYKDLANSKELSKEYLLDNRSYILGSMFGGTKDGVNKVANDIDNILKCDMIENHFVNNEQIALGYLVKNNPDDFSVYERYNGQHMALFAELGKR